MIKVFHLLKMGEKYNWVEVAEVQTEELEAAWSLTKHTGQEWTAHAAVAPKNDASHRSSAVGDIFCKASECYMVSNRGFVLIPRDLVQLNVYEESRKILTWITPETIKDKINEIYQMAEIKKKTA